MRTISTLKLGILTCCTLLLSFSIYAQKNITGLVNDDKGALAFANVLLLQPADSSLVTGNITNENGQYELENIDAGKYLLKVTMIGYQDQYSQPFTLENKSGQYAAPTMTLAESAAELGEVKVVAKRALIEQKIDRMVVNVSNSITSAGSTALEVLKRSPGVMVNPQSNSISMSGKDGVVVMINGKISRMPMDALIQMLGGMSSDNIDKIELIHTPPANFDAAGNAGFINIVLKKNQNEGLNGGYSVNAGYGKKEKFGASINLNYRKDKVNIFGDYSWNFNNNPQFFSNFRSFEFQGTNFENFSGGDRDPAKTHVQNAQLGIDIQLTDKTVIGGLVSFLDRNWNLTATNDVTLKEDGILTSRISIPNTEINHSYRILGNINVQHQITKGQKINFDIDYAYFFNDNPSEYLNRYFDGNDNLINETELRVSKITPMNILVGKLDHTKSYGDNLTWEVGIKGTLTSFDNDVLVEDRFDGGDWLRSSLYSSESEMRENIAAAFTAVSWKLNDKTDVKVGLRYEYTDVNLGTLVEPDIVDRQYGNLFPSVFLSNKINDANSFQFSYSRRINRPSFRQLAPWFYFTDPSTILTGNPLLQPSITDAVRGTYMWKRLTLSAQYSYTDGLINRFQPEVDEETNTQVNGAKNFLSGQNASATISFPLTINKWWEFRTSWTAQRDILKDNIDGEEVSFEQSSWYMNGTSTFQLPKKMAIEISGVYFSPSLAGATLWEPFDKLDIGISKELNNGANLRFSVSDVFMGANWRGRLDDPNVNFVYEGFYGFTERVFRLSYSNRFGNSKVKGARKRSTGSAEEQRRAN